MANESSNNGNGISPPGMPTKRAGKKQNTGATPERMKKKEQELMDIDLSEGSSGRSAPKSPQREGSKGRTTGSKGEKEGNLNAMVIERIYRRTKRMSHSSRHVDDI